MNANLISALSALADAVIGGVMSLLASWVANQRQVRSQWIAHDRSRRVQGLIDNGGDEDVRNQVRPHGAGGQE
jgi:hypothetical protein